MHLSELKEGETGYVKPYNLLTDENCNHYLYKNSTFSKTKEEPMRVAKTPDGLEATIHKEAYDAGYYNRLLRKGYLKKRHGRL